MTGTLRLLTDTGARAGVGVPPSVGSTGPMHVARTGDDEVTLCRSTGLAGSEVVLADALLDRIDRSRSRPGLGESHAPVR
ncbi:hypothetical protein ACQPZZ_00435 [Microbispora sp. CA-135349]|uniref:hypothetical protein n=1 Tax=Microbispora sp. CA-135349 TaxID=3239953 RepID=UPI003D94BA34